MGKRNKNKQQQQQQQPQDGDGESRERQGGGRRSAEELERGLAAMNSARGSGGGGGESDSSGSPNRRRSLSQTQQPQQQQAKAKEKATKKEPTPPQHVQRGTASTASGLGKDERGSRVVNPSQLPGGRDDPALAALAGGRLPPRAAAPAPTVAAPKGTAKPRGRAARNGATGDDDEGGRPSWLQWLRSLMFSREEFMDFTLGQWGTGAGSSTSARTPRDALGIKEWQECMAARLDRVRWMPTCAKRAIFDTIDFFTKARVYMVFALVVVVVLCAAAAPHTVDAITAVSGTFLVDEPDRPGKTFLQKFNQGNRTLPRRHPVAIMPGFITGALELWEARGTCLDRQATRYSTFRQHMFGAQMLFLLLTDPACWMELFGMDKKTGMDKDGVRVRADSGFASVEYFVAGYWVWAKVLINLADIGYDPQSMAVLTYDWRMSPAMAHQRDGSFYAARNGIKFLCQKNRERAVVISHSYGTTVALAFFKWADQREPGFMNRYVAYYVNVGGTTLGIPKAASALLMGDVKDTMMIPPSARKMFDSFVAQNARYNISRSWGCLVSMTPHGCGAALPNVITFADGSTADMMTLMDMIRSECERTNHTHCVEELDRHRAEAEELPVLPQAPDTAVICLYGVNKSAEWGYVVEDVGRRSRLVHNTVTGESIGKRNDTAANAQRDPASEPTEEEVERAFRSVDVAKWMTNTTFNDEGIVQGVRLGNGDGTVPLGSLAYMCRAPNGWVRNVGRVETVEFLDDSARANPLNLRGGSISGDHVDILGNYELIEMILKIVSGVDELGAEPGKDEVQWVEDDSGHATVFGGQEESGASKTRGKGKQKKDKSKRGKKGKTDEKTTVTLHRRVHSRILTNVDELIRTDWSECLAKPNNPITHKPPRDDENEFL